MSCDAGGGEQSSGPKLGEQAGREGGGSAAACCTRQAGREPVRGLQPHGCGPQGVSMDRTDQSCRPDRRSKGSAAEC